MPRGTRLDAPGVLHHHGPWNYANPAGDRTEWAWAKGEQQAGNVSEGSHRTSVSS